ncbi:MAG: DsbA family protein [Candidatus Shapirobacteria bacterium]|jgi:protein-disulfide isomerase
MKQQLQYSSFEKKLFAGVAIFSVLVLAISIFFINKTQSSTLTVGKEQAKEILTIKKDDWVKGPENAPITIVEYLDFECEACRVYYPIVKQLKDEYKDKVRFVVRYFPLPNHRNSMASAQSAETAGKQGKFWEMYDKLYDTQQEWGEKQVVTPSVFEEYAKQVGLDMDKYKNDVNSAEVRDRINRDKNSASSLGIQGTPTFFINGERIPNPKGYDDFKSLIDGLMPVSK